MLEEDSKMLKKKKDVNGLLTADLYKIIHQKTFLVNAIIFRRFPKASEVTNERSRCSHKTQNLIGSRLKSYRNDLRNEEETDQINNTSEERSINKSKLL